MCRIPYFEEKYRFSVIYRRNGDKTAVQLTLAIIKLELQFLDQKSSKLIKKG